MPGTLYVVATPIGNLEDVTLRALRVLRDVALIAAEDTRRTARLLQHYSISTRTTSLHEHNQFAKTASLIARLEAGDSIALVSDAGTPLISDPGAPLVTAAHEAGIRVEAIPGASAVMAALSASGLAKDEFLFVGFPPARSSERMRWLERLSIEHRTIVLYETPHRIRVTLAAMLDVWGDRRVALCRELTKMHEQLVIRPISGHIADALPEVGEFTLVVAPLPETDTVSATPLDTQLAADIFSRMTNIDGLSRREALKALSTRFKVPSRQIYDAVLMHKSSVD